MSKTSLDAVEILYKHLAASILMQDAQRPNGVLRKFQRPQGSLLEDVVIGSLGLTNEPVQEGVLNMNVFVPNRVVRGADGVVDASQPNTDRMKYLAALIKQSINGEVWGPNGDYTFKVQQDIPYEDENNQWFINFRIEFFTQSLNN